MPGVSTVHAPRALLGTDASALLGAAAAQLNRKVPAF